MNAHKSLREGLGGSASEVARLDLRGQVQRPTHGDQQGHTGVTGVLSGRGMRGFASKFAPNEPEPEDGERLVQGRF
jgi:hypothetical protein